MRVRSEELRAIVQQVWSSLLGLEARLCGGTPAACPGPQPGAGELISCVGIAGGLRGAVLFACPDALARRAAAAMFDLPLEQIAEAEVRDALGELTNVVAGNLLSSCLKGCQVLLPTMLDSASYQRSLASSRVVAELAFECPAGGFFFRVLEGAAI